MLARIPMLRRSPVFLLVLFALLTPRLAHAQGFISPSFGYNIGGDSGCPSALDCEDKNWNFAVSGGALGNIVGFEAEWLYEDAFRGKTANETSKVTTFMGNFLIAPRISIVQPYGLVGVGLMRTELENVGASDSENQIGWDIGGGVMVFVHRNVAIKGDIRYYHSFEASDLLGIDLNLDDNKLDFGRFGFGVVFKF